jgi:hypothetical protein
MKHFLTRVTLCIAAISAFAGSSHASGYFDGTGHRRGVAEFRADAQACIGQWEASHPRRANLRPHIIARTAVRSEDLRNARYNFLMNTCLPAHGWRPTNS